MTPTYIEESERSVTSARQKRVTRHTRVRLMTVAVRTPVLRSLVASYMMITTILPLMFLMGAPSWSPSLLVQAQASVTLLNVTAWRDCSEPLPNTDIGAQVPLLCSGAQTYTRLNIQGTVKLTGGIGGFFEGTVLDEEWQCVPSERDVETDSLEMNGKCTALPDNTRVQVTIGRPRYGWRLTYDSDVPYGYLLVNYTVNMSDPNATAAWFMSNPQLLDNSSTWLVNETCGGLANVEMTSQQACASILPSYITSDYMETCGACGDNPYVPLMRRALVSEAPAVAQMNVNSCDNSVLCYACNSTNSTLLTQRVVYQTYAFGGPCTVYRIAPTRQLYVDVFVNISVGGGVVRNGVYISGVYDQGQAQVGMSARSHTLRASMSIEADEAQIQVPQLNGYIIVCPDATAVNSTRPDGVLGMFNWLYNTSGYVPSFRWNQLVQPPAIRLGVGRQRLRGAYIYLTEDQYASRFQQVVQPEQQCALTNLIDPSSTLGTQSLYTNDAAVPRACAAPPYNASAVGNTSFYEQVHPGEGACVPGMDPRYNVEPGKRFARNQTVCQMIQEMDAYSQAWASASPATRETMGYPPFLPPQYDMDHPPYYLAQVDEQQSQLSETQLLLMYTPPSIGRGQLATFDVTVDVSTDLMPYVTEDTTYLVLSSPTTTQSDTICRFWMPTKTGYYSFDICQLGATQKVMFSVTVSQCDERVRFLEELPDSAQKGYAWSVSSDQLSATYSTMLLEKAQDSSAAGPYACVHSSILLFNLTESGLSQLGNVNGALLNSCRLDLNVTVWKSDGDQATITQSFVQECAAVNLRVTAPWSNVLKPDDLLKWQVWLGIIFGAITALIALGFAGFGIYYAINRVSSRKTTSNYRSVGSAEMNNIDTAVAQQMQSM